jgi:hypothetical protein
MKIGPNAHEFLSAHTDPAPDELAVRALAFLSRDEGRASRFLALTGLDAGDVPGLVQDRGFHLAILDYLASDEALLLAFADAERLAPEAIGRARRALGGGEA